MAPRHRPGLETPPIPRTYPNGGTVAGLPVRLNHAYADERLDSGLFKSVAYIRARLPPGIVKKDKFASYRRLPTHPQSCLQARLNVHTVSQL